MKFDVVDNKGKVVDSIEFAVKNYESINENVRIHQFKRFVTNKYRSGNASTKTRSEVKASGAKAYKQKGTGNARRGRNSSPLRPGGAVAFGPKPRSYDIKLNKKYISACLNDIVKKSSDKIIVLDKDFSLTKTSEVSKNITKSNDRILLLVSEFDYKVIAPFRNLFNIYIDLISEFEPEFLLTSSKVILSYNAADFLKERLK